uniref:Flagellin n=1 Tax=uncultured Armatimonadetes bacterium TaxID=157466 RepID=A0A6J4HZL6_9BACT|nr:hypothetical protein AVDCRST_MAG63-1387 [uncultured Armatimonadetes bacterium]
MGMGLRVTFGSLARGAQSGMEGALIRVARAQDKLTTGKRIQSASDDPGGASQLIQLNSTLGDLTQYRRNGEQGKGALSLADGALDSLGGLVREARTLTVQAANDTQSAESRQALAQKIGRIKEQVVAIANTNVSGRYLFAGHKTDTRPFDPADAANTYAGDAGSQRVEINRGEYVNGNLPGDAIFSQLLDDLDAVKGYITAGDTAGLSTTGMAKIDDGLKRVLGARGQVGSVINQIDATRARLDTAEQEFRTIASNIEEIDLPQAIVELQAAQNAYQASLASTSRTFQSSLMDYLR